MKKTKEKSSFKDRVARNSHKQKTQVAQYGYLNLPAGVEIFKEEPNSRVLLDFIPYKVSAITHLDRDDDLGIAVPEELWYKRPFWVHRNVGINNETVVCPVSAGRQCPICEYRAKRIREKAEKEELDSLKRSLRNLYLVIPRGHKDYEEKIHIWDISQFLFQNQLNEEIEEDPDLASFPDLEGGLSVRIRFAEASIGTGKPFASTSRIDMKDRDEDYGEEILKKVPDLDECLNILSHDKLEAKFFELESEVEEEPEEEPKRASFDDDDDDDDAQGREKTSEEEEEPEEDTRARRRAQRERKKKEAEQKEKRKGPECPHGHEFGKDCDAYPDDCNDCDEWDKCMDAQEAMEAEE